MSWWDSSALSTFATSALKTAQKRIDKVLDIKDDEDEGTPTEGASATSVSPPTVKTSDQGKADEGNFWEAYLGDTDSGGSLTGFTSTPSKSKSVSKPTARTPAPSSGSQLSPSNTSERSELKTSATSAFTVRSKRVESTLLKYQVKTDSTSKTMAAEAEAPLEEEKGEIDTRDAPSSLKGVDKTPNEPELKPKKVTLEKESGSEQTKKKVSDEGDKVSSDLSDAGISKTEGTKKVGPLRLGSKLSKKKDEETKKKVEREKEKEGEAAIEAQVEMLLEVEAKPAINVQTYQDEGKSSKTEKEQSSSDPQAIPEPGSEKTNPDSASLGHQKEWSMALEPAGELVASVEGSGWEEGELDIDDITEESQPEVPLTETISKTGEDNEPEPSKPEEKEVAKEEKADELTNPEDKVTSHTGEDVRESDSPCDASIMEASSHTQSSVEVIEVSELNESVSESVSVTDEQLTAKDSEPVLPTYDESPRPSEQVSESYDSAVLDLTDSVQTEAAKVPAESGEQESVEPLATEVSFSSSDTTEATGDDQLSESSRTLTGDDFRSPQEEEEAVKEEEAMEEGQEEPEMPGEETEAAPSDPSPSDAECRGSSEAKTCEEDSNDSNSKKTGALVSSSYVKTMLEEAMVESVKDTDSHSSSSTSDKSSEMVRIESGLNSGHTSGDEIDTTTSSDIEIISTPTPNGEYRQERPFDLSPLRHALSRTMRRGSPPGHKRSDSSSSGQSTWSKNGDDLLSPEGGAHRDTESSPESKRDERQKEQSAEAQLCRKDKGDPEMGASDPLETQKLLKDKGRPEEASTPTSTTPPHQSLHTIVEKVEPADSLPETRSELSAPASVCARPGSPHEGSGDIDAMTGSIEKLAEMAEILEAREKKLVELSRENIDLQESKAILKNQLQQSEEAREAELEDLNTVTEEFTARISDFEQRLQLQSRERDALKKQMMEAQNELMKKSSSSSGLERLMKEKDQQVAELLEEGEKLSKQQLQSNNIIKKLRAKEKDNDAILKSQKQKMEKQAEELEHLRMVLDAKEEVERKQIEAIAQQNAAVKKQEAELTQLRGELEDMQEKARGLQAALDNSYKEISELHKANAAAASQTATAKLSVEMQAKQELQMAMERQQLTYKQQMEALMAQIEDHQLSMVRQEREQGRREDVLRQEISDVQQRLQEAEERNQDLTQSVTSATRPLLRQIENLQSTYTAQSGSYEKVERNLTERLNEAQNSLAEAVEKERAASERLMEVTSRLTSLETQVSSLRQEKSHLQAQLEVERTKVMVLEDAKNSESAQLEVTKTKFQKEITELKKEKIMVENQLEMERMKVEAEKKKLILAHEQLRDKELQLSRQGMTPSPRSSSQDDSASLEPGTPLTVSVTQEDILEKTLLLGSTANGNKTNLYETLRHTGAATLVENLQSQLKMKEGEIAQLQNEISEFERTREAMARELVNLSTQNTGLLEQLEEYPELKKAYGELDSRYNALLQMYGEKVEEAEELNMDLQDIKDMYKAQIEELLKRVR